MNGSKRDHIFILTAVVLLIANVAFAQVPIHLDTNGLVKGIYRDFSEFKYNKPGIIREFEMREKLFSNINTTTHAGFSMVCSACGINPENIFGVCDGKNIYIRSDEKMAFDKERWFEKMRFLGRYSIYTKLIIGAREGTEGSLYILPNRVRDMFISLKTGRTFELDYNHLLDVLEKDPLMLKEFKNDRKNHKRLEFYLKNFAERHKDDYSN